MYPLLFFAGHTRHQPPLGTMSARIEICDELVPQ
jgi:hypothetical protein